MASSIVWISARLVSLALGVFAFSQAIPSDTNFGLVGGIICGAVLFAFVLFTVIKKSARDEEMLSLTSPFFPPWKYVQTYWFTIGVLIFLSSVTNLIFNLSDPAAISLYAGLASLGAGLLTGTMFAHYRLGKQGPSADSM